MNFPDPKKIKIKGIKICRAVNGVWKEKFIPANNPHGKKSFWLSGSFTNFEPEAKDTDEYALKNGFASIVPVKIDFTAYNYINILKEQGFDSIHKGCR